MPNTQTLVVKGPHSADYFQNEMFPDKTLTTGHFISVAEDTGAPFANWDVLMPLAYKNTKSVTMRISWFSVSVSTGDVVWDAEIERLEIDGNPLTASNFAAPQSDTSAVSTTQSALSKAVIVFSSAQFDAVETGENFRVRITRDTSSGSDTMVGDAFLLNFSLESDVDN